MIDCRSLECACVPAGSSQVKFLVTNSQVKHALVSIIASGSLLALQVLASGVAFRYDISSVREPPVDLNQWKLPKGLLFSFNLNSWH